MKIFISWSGKASNQVAKILKDWLPNVIQDIDVYVSSQDIASGERWLSSVNSNLEEHDFGISVLTEENIISPWILYEAGAIAKSLTTTRLIPVLCGIDGISITNHPLSQFQYVKAPVKDEMMRLLSSINSVTSRPLAPERLKAQLEKWHHDFETEFTKVKFPENPKKQEKSEQSFGDQLEAVMNAQELILNQLRDIRSLSLDGGSKNLLVDLINDHYSGGIFPSKPTGVIRNKLIELGRAKLDQPNSDE